MNGLGLSISALSSLGLSRERFQLIGQMFAPPSLEGESRLESELNVLSQLSKSRISQKPELLNLFNSSDLSQALSEISSRAFRLIDGSNLRDWFTKDSSQELNKAQNLYLSQLSSQNIQSLFAMNSYTANDNKIISGISQLNAATSSLSQINEVSLPPTPQNFQTGFIRNEPNATPRNDSVYRPLQPQNPFEAIRRPYEKTKPIRDEKKRNLAANPLKTAFRAVKNFVSGIVGLSATA